MDEKMLLVEKYHLIHENNAWCILTVKTSTSGSLRSATEYQKTEMVFSPLVSRSWKCSLTPQYLTEKIEHSMPA